MCGRWRAGLIRAVFSDDFLRDSSSVHTDNRADTARIREYFLHPRVLEHWCPLDWLTHSDSFTLIHRSPPSQRLLETGNREQQQRAPCRTQRNGEKALDLDSSPPEPWREEEEIRSSAHLLRLEVWNIFTEILDRSFFGRWRLRGDPGTDRSIFLFPDGLKSAPRSQLSLPDWNEFPSRAEVNGPTWANLAPNSKQSLIGHQPDRAICKDDQRMTI